MRRGKTAARRVGRKKLAAMPLALALALTCGCGGAGEPAAVEGQPPQEETAEVPPEYDALYAELEARLAELDAHLGASREGDEGDTVFSVELVTANGNRGEELLEPLTLEACKVILSRLKALGLGGVTLSVQYPTLNPDFPRSGEYLDFYRQVAAEARSLGLVLIVETTSVFPNTEISPLGFDYSGLTLEEYTREKRAMAETVLRELAPDYLTVENEPSTQRANTGLAFSVADQTALVNGILSGLERGGTRIGAGAGSWDDLAYFESLAANTDLDYLDIHFYPVQGDFVLDRAERIAGIARAAGKRLAVSECWLYKASSAELASGQDTARAAGIFARDAYSFWAPLDQAFLAVMVRLARRLEMEFLSPFWMQYLYAYLDYGESRGMGYAEIQRASGQAAWPNIQAGLLSPTGEAYRDLIAGD